VADHAAPGFHIASFAIDGELMGMTYWELAKLSGQWLTVCSAFLDAHGPVFHVSWPGQLSHIRTKFTSAEGAALVTLFVNDEMALMAMLASGRSATADAELAAMFVRFLQDLTSVNETAAASDSFSQITTLLERPLMVAVPWPLNSLADSDRDLVTELSWHLAGAFFST